MYIRGDADSSFLSAEFQQWAVDNKAAANFAAPHHQEMNGLCEVAPRRTIDTMARTSTRGRSLLQIFMDRCYAQ